MEYNLHFMEHLNQTSGGEVVFGICMKGMDVTDSRACIGGG